MPRALAVGIREVIVERHLTGMPLPQIAAELDLSVWTVRTVWRRYRDRGREGLAPNYANCGRRGPRHPAVLVETALALRREHRRWGAGLIRTTLGEVFPDWPLPNERTLRHWFATAGLAPPPRPPAPPSPPRATVPHDRWQLDASEQIRLADETRVSWLAASDEATGAMLGAAVFPPRHLDAGGPTGGASGGPGVVRHLGAAQADAL